jgi:cyclopropane fatty-acyl-phospholipid synthase-like methyltransferase
MHWDTYSPEIKALASRVPGGPYLIDRIVEYLDIEQGRKVLNICPGTGIVGAMIAKEFDVDTTVTIADAATESDAEARAKELGVSKRVNVIPASPDALPEPSEEYDRILCIGTPFFVRANPEVARELHRVLNADGMIGIAGPMSLRNETPDYMQDGLAEYPGVVLRTPAYTALTFSREGFHIVKAEYIPDAWDRWKDWLDAMPAGDVPDEFRRAVTEDGGRWLSLGLILLRKPPRPEWAV